MFKIRKITALVLSLVITGTMVPCSAANLIPFNGAKPIVTPAVPITNPETNNSTDCEKCTFDEAIDLKDKEGYLCINPDIRILVPKAAWVGIAIMYIVASVLGCCSYHCCDCCCGLCCKRL